MFNDTVTIYNKYKDGTIEKWQRTVLTGVYWNAIKGAVSRKTGITSVDSVQLIIPFAAGAMRSHKPPKEWQGLVDKQQFWTLQSGDTVIKGDKSYEVAKSSKELEQFDDCLSITSVDTKSFGGGMAHFEVGAK